jgi:hypothetical protein
VVDALDAEGVVDWGERVKGGFEPCWNGARLMPR